VTAVFVILILLILAAPVVAVAGGVIPAGLLLAIAAVAIALIVLTLPAGEFRRMATLWKPIAPIVLVPCIWMLVQIVPVPGWFAHPVWISASAALGEPLAGAITLDVGATLLALGRYSLALAIAVVATAASLNRKRAETILIVVTAAAASVAAGLIGLELGLFRIADLDLSAQLPEMLTITVVGFVLSFATALRVYENHRRHRATRARDASTTVAATVSFVATVICLSGIAMSAEPALLLAAASGALIMIGLAVIYRLRLGPWGQSGIFATAVVVLIGFFAAIPANRAVDPALTLSSQPSVSISDAKWVGTGAGTFAALLPIYRDIDDANLDAAPTAAASIAIEMGRPLLWLFVIVALIGVLSLLRRALARGREYVFAGAGAACIVAVLVSSFANAGALGLGASLLTCVVCGLALAQSRSWRA
jgi:hypothetical protein